MSDSGEEGRERERERERGARKSRTQLQVMTDQMVDGC